MARWTDEFDPPTEGYGTGEIQNMTLKSLPQDALAVPTNVWAWLVEEDVDEVTLNTDLIGYMSRDDGTTWSAVTLSEIDTYSGDKRILTGVADLSGQPSGTNMRYKVETANEKNLKLYGVGMRWS